MNWLVLSYFLTAGLTLHQNVAIQSPAGYMVWQPPDNSVETMLGVELLVMDHLFLSASVRTEEQYFHGINFSPFLSEYNLKAGLRFGGFEAVFVDDCIHPQLDSNFFRDTFLYGGWSGFYVSFKGSAKLF